MRIQVLFFKLTFLFLFPFCEILAHSGERNQLLFLENKGQWPAKVKYRTSIESHQIWLEQNKITFELINASHHPLAQLHNGIRGNKTDTSKIYAHIYTVEFEGSITKAIESQQLASPTYYNFFQDSDKRKWVSDVKSFEGVRYKQLYQGVDMKLYGQNGLMKYDFELAAGNNGERISMKYAATSGLKIQNGKLRIKTALGTVEEHIPKAYQIINGNITDVPCEFILEGNTVRFRFLKRLDSRYETVIDPVYNFFTYSGSLADNWGNTAVSDSAGNSYTAGTVYGADFPTTIGVIGQDYFGTNTNPYTGYDVGILKFNPTGSQLLWCTYLGGKRAETPHALKIDESQNLVVMGTTSSENFPTTSNAYEVVFKGGPLERPFFEGPPYDYPTYVRGSDIFITKIKKDGKQLIGSTFIGGSDTDGLMNTVDELMNNYGDQFRGDIQIGGDGFIYLASHTKSSDFPLKTPYQANLRGSMDGIVAKFSSGLNELIWSTYLGGDDIDAFFSLQLTNNQKVVVCGGSKSANFPTTANAYQKTGKGGIDGIVGVFDANTGQYQSGTYTGTTAYDLAFLIQTDIANNIYVFGQTQGQMPLTANVFGQAKGGQFLQKFSPDLSILMWGSTFGTTQFQPNIVPTALLVDSCKRIFVAGWGGKINYQTPGFAGGYTIGLPISSDAFRSVSDSSDFYFMVLAAEAKSLVFGSYFGSGNGRGEHVDGGTSHFDKRGIITQAVCGCIDLNGLYFKGTSLAYRSGISGSNCNNGVMKINLADLKADFKFDGELKCPATLTLMNESQNGERYTWFFGNGDSLVSNNTSIQYKYPTAGTFIITLKATNPKTCKISAYAFDTITIPNPFKFDTTSKSDLYCVGDTLHPIFDEFSGFAVQWEPSTYVSNPTSYKPDIIPLSSIKYKVVVTDSLGCRSFSQYVTRNREINLGFGYEKIFDPCFGRYVVRYFSNRDSSDRYIWHFENGDTATGKSVTRNYSANGKYVVRLNGIKASCEENAIDTVVLNDVQIVILPEFTVERKYMGCDQPSWIFKNKTNNAQSYVWDFGDGYKSTEIEPEHKFAEAGSYKITLEGFQHSCREGISKTLIVDQVAIPSLITSNNDGKNEGFKINGLQPGWKLEIYNRWGHSIYKTDNYQNDWVPDAVKEGIYFYNITFPEGSHCNGWLDVMKGN